MFRPRIIPVLLLQDQYLVKTTKFKKPNYIGDPINAVRIFNDLKADELVFLDIEATQQKRLINVDFVKQISEEANMPFAAGGGIQSLHDIQQIIASGAEKVIIGNYALENPEFIKQAAATFGSSTIVVCIDIKKNFFGKQKIVSLNASKTWDLGLTEFIELMQMNGAGELIIQSVDNDGTMNGYDIDLTSAASQISTIPIVALGGAGNILDLKNAYTKAYATGLAAGSMFVYQGVHKGVLINYLNKEQKQTIYE